MRNKEYLSFKANRVTVPILNNNNLKKLEISFPKDLEFQRKVISQLDNIQVFINKKIEIVNLLEKLIHSVYFYMFGDPVNNQKAFPLKKLNQIIPKDRTITYGIVQPGAHVENGIPFIRTSDVKKGKINENLLKTNNEISQRYSRTICSIDDIVITIRATIGEVAKIKREHVGINISRELAIITPNKEIINPNYLLVTLMSKGFQFKINQFVKGVAIKGISLDELRELTIPVPKNIDLQKKFSQIYETIDEIKGKVEQSLEILQNLFQVILQSAFKPDAQIDEEPIFKDLIKKFSIHDLKDNKQRLQYLINLFDQQNFDEFKDYTETRKILFELLEANEIIQVLKDSKVKLQIK